MGLNRIIVGTWGLGGPNRVGDIELGWPEITKPKALELLELCYDHGVRKYDTSDMYGRGKSELLLGELVRTGASGLKIITKGGVIPEIELGTSRLVKNFSIEYLETAFQKSLERLHSNSIYGYLLHGIKFTQLHKKLLLFSEHLKNNNLIENFGVSASRYEPSLSELSEITEINFIELPYTLVKPNSIHLVDEIKPSNTKYLFRSIFFHGLLLHEKAHSFKTSDHRNAKINEGLRRKLGIFHQQLKKKDIRPIEAMLTIILGSPHNADIVYGAKSIEQTKDFLMIYENCSRNFSATLRNEILSDASDLFASR